MKKIINKQVVIVGAGLIGSIMAIALAKNGFKVALIDGKSAASRYKKNFDRTYAFSRTSIIHSSRAASL